MAVSEEEVRKSFDKAKEDILQLKRAINKQLFSIDELTKSMPDYLQKDEFYAFIKRLGLKVEELENQFPAKSDREDVEELASELQEESAALRKLVEKRDELAEEVRQVRKLQGKVLELEGIAVPKTEFSKELTRLKADVAAIKAETAKGGRELSLTSESLSKLSADVPPLKSATAKVNAELSSLSISLAKLTGDLAEIGKNLSSLSAAAVLKEDIASFTERIESSREEMSRGFSSLKRDFDKKVHNVDRRMEFLGSVEEKLLLFNDKLAAAENSIAEVKESSSKKFADKQGFEKAVSELRSKISETKQLLDSSISEVNLDDYVTKRSVKQQLASLSDSVTSTINSAVSSKIGSVGEQLQSVKSQLDSAQKSLAKQLGKAKEEAERLSSRLVSSDEFNSKVEKLRGSHNELADDLKREIRRQRELFEERLKSVEAHYRASAESLRAELDDLRSKTKALSKAEAGARAAMAKISTSAAKVAAKTATELIEEAEEEEEKERLARKKPGKGISPLTVSIAIVVLLIIGSVAYVVFKGPEVKEAPEIAPSPSPPLQPPPPNITIPSAEGNVSLPQPPQQPQPPELLQPEINVSVNVSNVSVEPVLTIEDRNRKCREELECTKRSATEYWFDCYFDDASQQCRCFVGSIDNCPHLKKAEEEANMTNATAAAAERGKAPSLRYYVVVAFVVLVVLFFTYKTLFAKEEKEVKETAEAKKEPKPKAEKQAKKEKEKPAKAEKAEAEAEEDVIDLEEFFQKK